MESLGTGAERGRKGQEGAGRSRKKQEEAGRSRKGQEGAFPLLPPFPAIPSLVLGLYRCSPAP